MYGGNGLYTHFTLTGCKPKSLFLPPRGLVFIYSCQTF